MTPLNLNERRAFLVALSFLGICFLFLLKPFMIAISLAIIITTLLHPVYIFFLKRFKGRRYLASFVTTLITFLVLVLPFTVIVVLLVSQALDILSSWNIDGFFTAITSRSLFQEYIDPVLAVIEQKLHVEISLAPLVSQFGKEAIHYVYSYSPQVLGRTAGVIFNFFIMHFSIYFLFVEGRDLLKVVLDLSPLKEKYEKRLAGEFRNMIYATVYGYLMTALFQAFMAGFGFWVVGLDAFLVFATITFFMSLVPLVGAAAVWIPITIWLFMQGDTKSSIFLGIYGAVIISGIDNIIKPLIMRGKANIHILLILFSLLGGISLFGPIGILFGPVITAMFVASIRIYREDFLHMKGLK